MIARPPVPPAPADPRPGTLARANLAITAVSLIVLAAFGFSMAQIRANIVQHAENSFQLDARPRFNAIQNELTVAASVAEATGRFSPAFAGIDPIAFSGFLGGITGRYPWISAVEWVPKVAASKRGRFTAAVATVLPGYHIRDLAADGGAHRSGARPAYYPVTLVEPLSLAYQVAGLDMDENPQMRRTLAAAGESGELRTTEILPGIRETNGRSAAILAWPVYNDVPVGGATPAAWRLMNLRGFAIVVVDIAKLVASGRGVTEEAPAIDIATQPSGKVPTLGSTSFTMQQRLDVAGRTWWLSATAPKAGYEPSPVVTWLGLAAAALITIVVLVGGLSARSLVKRNILIRRLHREMAAFAAFSQDILDTLREPVAIVDGNGAIVTVNQAWMDWQLGEGTPAGPDEIGRYYGAVMARTALAVSRTHEIALRSALNATLAGIDEDRECDIRVAGADGAERWFTVRLRAFTHLERRHVLIAHADISRLKLAEHELRLQAITDGLTQLANRRHFEEKIREEAERCLRYGRPLVLLILDVDHFKRVNDTYGHPAGDAVLRRVADICRQSTRGLDLAARFGGEEFAMLFPETDLPGAAQVAERIRQEIQAASVVHGADTIQVTISGGLAHLKPEDVEARQLVIEADAALYEAKQAGRNRVICRA